MCRDAEDHIKERVAMLIRALGRLQRLDAILEVTDRFMARVPELVIARASCLERAGRLEEAAVCYEKAMALSAVKPADHEVIVGAYSRILRSLNKWGALRGLSQQQMAKSPSTALHHHHFLQSLRHLNEPKLAAEHAVTLRAEHEDSPSIQFVLGRYYQNEGELDGAESCFRIAAECEPKNGEFQHFYIRSLLDRGRQSEAAKHCRFLLDEDPQNAHCIAMTAFFLFEAADYESAAKHFKKCVDLMPDETGFATDYAMALCEIPGRLKEAERVVAAVLKEHPDSVPAQYRMARILHLEEEHGASQAVYRRILEKEPRRRRVNMGFAHLLHAAGEYAESARYFETAKAVDGANPFYHFWFALLLIDDHHKRYREGVESLERCLEIKPSFHVAHYEMARLFCDVMDCRKEEALEHMEAAAKIHRKSEHYKRELERMRTKLDCRTKEEGVEEEIACVH